MVDDLKAAVERCSQAMLDDYEVQEIRLEAGLYTSQTLVRVPYDALRQVLAAADKVLAS